MLVKEILLGKLAERTPLWMMRQAGRYLPEYKKIRAHFPSFMEFCYTPDAATEVTLQPIDRFDFDAAIIFSDILVIPDALGQKVSFKPDHGPVLSTFQQDKLRFSDVAGFKNHLQPVYEAISQTRSKLSKDKALYGFAGSPWTLACYMVEEGKSEAFAKIKAFQKHSDFRNLLDNLTDMVGQHLIAQIDAGADIVQVFDSWASLIDREDFEDVLIKPALRIAKIVHETHPQTPVVYYARGGADLPVAFANAARDYCHPLALGIHHDVDLAVVKDLPFALQGNLSPEVLLTGGQNLDRQIDRILFTTQGKPHIFNLGHGILKETPINHVERLVEKVRSFRI